MPFGRLKIDLQPPCLTCIALPTYAHSGRSAPLSCTLTSLFPDSSCQRRCFRSMEPISRLPSPWGPDSSPAPSPGPPPSPVYWMPYESTPGPRKEPTHVRSLPLIPQNGMHPPLRTNTTFSPLPEHPDFLRGLQSHPLIIQRGDYSSRTPSPASSMEVLQHRQPEDKPAGPIPFPMSSTFTSPELYGSPRPLPSVGSSVLGVRSLPTTNESSPARTPDPALLPLVPAFPSTAALPPPPPPLIPHPVRNSGHIQLKMPSPPKKKGVPASRPRLPALRRSVENVATAGPRPQSAESTSSASSSSTKQSKFYMPDGMVVLKVSRPLRAAV